MAGLEFPGQGSRSWKWGQEGPTALPKENVLTAAPTQELQKQEPPLVLEDCHGETECAQM